MAVIVLGVLIATDAVTGQASHDAAQAQADSIAAASGSKSRDKADGVWRQRKRRDRSVYSRHDSHSGRRQWKRAHDGRLAPTDTAAARKFATLTQVDVNRADSATLRRIPGVGEKTARWIVTYRQRVGGFHHISQLLDIPIVSADLLEWFSIDSVPALRTIGINTASFRQLNAHPYISYQQAKALAGHRRLYGAMSDSTALAASGIFSAGELGRLMPYITFE